MKIIINASWEKKIRKTLEVNERLFKSKKSKDEFIKEIKQQFPKGSKVNIKIIESSVKGGGD